MPKAKVIKQASGYWVCRGEECLFFRDDDPIDFFEKISRGDGARICQDCGIDAMEELAASYSVGTIYDNKKGKSL